MFLGISLGAYKPGAGSSGMKRRGPTSSHFPCDMLIVPCLYSYPKVVPEGGV